MSTSAEMSDEDALTPAAPTSTLVTAEMRRRRRRNRKTKVRKRPVYDNDSDVPRIPSEWDTD
ncbi:hypothetical protein BYT27DRAFT_7184125 [Phlegmacium glaucopus]|nr:hypothetical protein BYT27DRAFT_7184125 [Phlegmacium glaucopus]